MNTNFKNNTIVTFNTKGTDSDYKKYDGQKVRILRPLTDKEVDFPDVGKMYKVCLKENSKVIFDAFENELSYITETTHKCIVEFNRSNGLLFPNQDGNNWWWNFEYFRFNTDGSITCKASQEALNIDETQSLAVAILWENGLDAQLVGEDGCAGNFDMYTPIYFPNIGLAFLVLYSISDQFARGKEVTIYGYEPSKEKVLEFIEYWNEH